VALAGSRHRAGRFECAGLRVVQLRGGEEGGVAAGPARRPTTDDQDLPVGKQGPGVAAASVRHGACRAEHARPRVVVRRRGEGPVARGEAPRDEDAAVGEQRGGLDLPTVAERAHQADLGGRGGGWRRRRRRCRRRSRGRWRSRSRGCCGWGSGRGAAAGRPSEGDQRDQGRQASVLHRVHHQLLSTCGWSRMEGVAGWGTN
jgi:hypothetical protein